MKISLSIAAALLVLGTSARAAEPVPLPRITPAELEARIGKDAKLAGDSELVILDVRSAAEFVAGHVPGARNLPHDEVAGRLPELSGLLDKTVVLYCRSGRRSALAAEQLRAAGFTRLLQLDGDYPGWDAGLRPVERASAPAASVTN
jgi:rhodanese-related sulfurtransferase